MPVRRVNAAFGMAWAIMAVSAGAAAPAPAANTAGDASGARQSAAASRAVRGHGSLLATDREDVNPYRRHCFDLDQYISLSHGWSEGAAPEGAAKNASAPWPTAPGWDPLVWQLPALRDDEFNRGHDMH